MAKQKPTAKLKSTTLAKRLPKASGQSDFATVLQLIDAARNKAMVTVNTTLIELYWSIGEYISKKTVSDGWGQGTVVELSKAIQRQYPTLAGYSTPNLWRMVQFYETYRQLPKLSPLVRVLSWTHNVIIMNRCKLEQEKEFYLRQCQQEKWTKRQLERQLSGALFERTVLSPPKLSPLVRVLHPEAFNIFKDTYLLEFLDLPKNHSEADLQTGLVEHLKDFLIELGRDFCYVGSQYPLQVGKRDFALDLLFFNRALNCLIAFELKLDEFQPEYLGKLEFYLEALDRKVRKPHEKPSIGVLLCATKDTEVVEYALSRSTSPALIAEYQAHLPSKAILQRKLHEFYLLVEEQSQAAKTQQRVKRKKRPGRK